MSKRAASAVGPGVRAWPVQDDLRHQMSRIHSFQRLRQYTPKNRRYLMNMLSNILLGTLVLISIPTSTQQECDMGGTVVKVSDWKDKFR
jgi:hypothetical protein